MDSVASERLDRVATVSHLAMGVLEGEPAAIDWLSRSNEALGVQAPIMLCGTDIEAKTRSASAPRYGVWRGGVKTVVHYGPSGSLKNKPAHLQQ